MCKGTKSVKINLSVEYKVFIFFIREFEKWNGTAVILVCVLDIPIIKKNSFDEENRKFFAKKTFIQKEIKNVL